MNSDTGFIDLHIHLIPAVDDGPRRIQSTLELLRRAHQNGVHTLVATPHMFLEPYNLTVPDRVRDRFESMQKALEELSNKPHNNFLRHLSLHLGAENLASQPFLQALQRNEILTLAGSRYLLVEFTPLVSMRQVWTVVERIQSQDLVPILAHIERYDVFRSHADELGDLLEKGCLTQVNLQSLLQPIWSRTGRMSRRLVRQDLVSLIASDAHGRKFRPPDFGELMRKQADRLGRERLIRLCSENPAWIVRDGQARSQPGHSISNSN